VSTPFFGTTMELCVVLKVIIMYTRRNINAFSPDWSYKKIIS
jgi:hypothetical protein